MKAIRCLLPVLLLGSFLVTHAAEPPPPPPTLEQALQSALLAEEARRDLNAAIRAYEDIAARVDAERAMAATAIFRLGECYRKVGRTNEAVTQFKRLLRDYPGEATLGRLGRENLVALGQSPPTLDIDLALPAPAAGGPVAAVDESREIQRLRTLFDRSPDLLNAAVDGRSPLVGAAAAGQFSVVRALLDWGADVNRLASGTSALHAAAAAGHRAIVETLLGAKANPEAHDGNGRTPLEVAVAEGHEAVVESLLAGGARLRADPDQRALYAAVNRGWTNLIERLVRAGGDVNGVRGPERPGSPYAARTPLEQAVRSRQRESSRALIRLGAVVLGEDNANHPLRTALFGMPQMPSPDWIAELLAAKPKSGFPPGLLHGLLASAADSTAHEAYLPALLAAGAEVNALSPDETPPLCLAAKRGSERALELLLGARPELNAVNRDGQTALHLAAQRGDTNLIAPLLRAGADPNRLDAGDRTPLSLVQSVLEQWRANLAATEAEATAPPGGPPAGGPVGVALPPNPGAPSAPGARPGSAEPRRQFENYRAAESLLLASGARSDIVRRLGVHARRGTQHSRVLERRSDDSSPTLADFLITAFRSDQVPPAFQWTDFARIRVFRLSADGRTEVPVALPPAWWTRGDGCDWNVALEWGDVVELPEADHVKAARWRGMPDATRAALMRCGPRRVTLRIKDRDQALELRPATLAPSMSGANASIAVSSEMQFTFATDGSAADASTEAGHGEPLMRDTCILKLVVLSHPGLRSSSDLSRVRVIRKASGQSWTFDVNKDPRAARFWLVEGDRIEVPERMP